MRSELQLRSHVKQYLIAGLRFSEELLASYEQPAQGQVVLAEGDGKPALGNSADNRKLMDSFGEDPSAIGVEGSSDGKHKDPEPSNNQILEEDHAKNPTAEDKGKKGKEGGTYFDMLKNLGQKPKDPTKSAEDKPMTKSDSKRSMTKKSTKLEMIDSHEKLLKHMRENKTSWMDFFYQMDSNNKELVSSYEVYSLLVKQMGLSKKLATKIIKDIDFDHDGFATIQEWMKYESKLPKDIQINTVYKGQDFLTKLFNTMKEKQISWQQIFSLSLKDQSKEDAPTTSLQRTLVNVMTLSKSSAKEFLQKIDKDQDGLIMQREWTTYFREEEVFDQEIRALVFPKKEKKTFEPELLQKPAATPVESNWMQTIEPIVVNPAKKEIDFGIPMPKGDFVLYVEGDIQNLTETLLPQYSRGIFETLKEQNESDSPEKLDEILEDFAEVEGKHEMVDNLSDEFAEAPVGAERPDSSDEASDASFGSDCPVLPIESLKAAGTQAFAQASILLFDDFITAIQGRLRTASKKSVYAALKGLIVARGGSISLEEWNRFAAA